MYDFLTTSMYFMSNFFIASTVDFLIENYGEIEHEYVIHCTCLLQKLFETFFSEIVMEQQCKTDKQKQNSPNECFT